MSVRQLREEIDAPELVGWKYFFHYYGDEKDRGVRSPEAELFDLMFARLMSVVHNTNVFSGKTVQPRDLMIFKPLLSAEATAELVAQKVKFAVSVLRSLSRPPDPQLPPPATEQKPTNG